MLRRMCICAGVLIAFALTGCGGGGGGSSSLPPVANINTGGGAAASGGSASGGASSAASPSPGSSVGSSAPSGASVSSTASDAGYTQITNPGPWPASFRPYCANNGANPGSPCPWNDPLPDNPQQLYPSSATIVSNLFGSVPYVSLAGDWSISGDFNHPTYYASTSDPLVTVTCTNHCGVSSATFNIPSSARAAGYGSGSTALDGHMAIIEPDGTEWDMYQATSYSGQSSFSAGGLYKTSILGSGQIPNGGTTSGAALAAGIIRADELARGNIPHALFATTNCVSGSYVYPGASQATSCAGGGGPPLGARLQLKLTDSQINALRLPAWETAILHAMHDYGVYILDTNGGSSPGNLYFRFESQTQYAAYGVAYPYASMGLGITGFDSGLNWAQNFQIVAPCYSQETCTQ